MTLNDVMVLLGGGSATAAGLAYIGKQAVNVGQWFAGRQQRKDDAEVTREKAKMDLEKQKQDLAALKEAHDHEEALRRIAAEETTGKHDIVTNEWLRRQIEEDRTRIRSLEQKIEERDGLIRTLVTDVEECKQDRNRLMAEMRREVKREVTRKMSDPIGIKPQPGAAVDHVDTSKTPAAPMKAVDPKEKP